MNNYVTLTDEEIVLLDGKCSSKVQEKVVEALARINAQKTLPDMPPHIASFIADVVNSATQNGKLVFQHTSLRSCRYCKKDGGYRTYKRTGRYHRKGEKDYSKPIYISGIELEYSHVRIQGSAGCGCCNECFAKARTVLVERLKNVKAELPDKLMGAPSQYKRYDNRKCTACNWEGHEGEMGKLPALMGGLYPGECPKCHAQNLAFGKRIIEFGKGFTVV